MDLYFQAAAVSLAGAAFAYLVYVMMTPAQMFAPFIEATNQKIQARIDSAVNLDIAMFDNNDSVPGTAIKPLIQDASTNNLAIFHQSRASKGLVVNYGRLLRSAGDTTVALSNSGKTGVGSASDFEKNYVSPIKGLFGEISTGSSESSMGTSAMFGSSAEAFYTARIAESTFPIGLDSSGLMETDDPLLHFFDSYTDGSAKAANKGMTYSSSGYLYTPAIIRTNMPSNDNTSYATKQGNVYSINLSANYYTAYVVDGNGTVVGIYIEEHGCSTNSNILAQAMKASGHILETFE